MGVTFLTTQDADIINTKLGQLQETIDKLIGTTDRLVSSVNSLDGLRRYIGEMEERMDMKYKRKYEAQINRLKARHYKKY